MGAKAPFFNMNKDLVADILNDFHSRIYDLSMDTASILRRLPNYSEQNIKNELGYLIDELEFNLSQLKSIQNETNDKE